VPAVAGISVVVPLVAWVPLQLPEAVQAVALDDDHVSVVELPTTMELAAKLRVGAAGGAVTVKSTELTGETPSAFEQLNE
jgi:hypothetical protein